MRWFVRKSIKKGRVCSFNRYYYSKSCDKTLKCLVEGNNNGFETSSTYNIIETFINIEINTKRFLRRNITINFKIIMILFKMKKKLNKEKNK